jgi:alkylated DNA nucleotide flippase Atl1
MTRSDEAEAFFFAVYSAIQEIPPGKVTSYRHIAKLIGTRENLLLIFSSLPYLAEIQKRRRRVVNLD